MAANGFPETPAAEPSPIGLSRKNYKGGEQFRVGKTTITNFGATEDEQPYLFGVSLSPSCSRLLTYDSRQTVSIFDPLSLSLVLEMKGHTNKINEVIFSNSDSENFVLSSSDDSTVRCWDVRSGKQTHQFSDREQRVAFSACDTNPLVCVGFGEAITLWDVRKGAMLTKPLVSFDVHSDDVTQVRIRPDNRSELITAGSDGLINFLSLHDYSDPDESLISTLSGQEAIEKIGFFDGSTNIWSISANETLSTYHLPTETQTGYWGISLREELTRLCEIQTDYLVCGLPLLTPSTPDSFGLLTGSFDGNGVLWEVSSGSFRPVSHLTSLPGVSAHTSSIRSCACAPDWSAFWTVGEDSRLCSWQRDNGEGVSPNKLEKKSKRNVISAKEDRNKRATPY